jgi:ribonuclease HI
MKFRKTYTAPYPPHPPTPSHIDTTPIRHFHAAWTPTDFIYTYGSQIAGNPTLGASVVDPKHNTITHIETKSQPKRHTINKAELAAITTALDAHRHDPSLSILIDSAFSINNLRNFSSQPHAFHNHQYKELLKLADNIIREKDLKECTAHIGKVKSHTGVVYTDAADEGARSVVDGKTRPDITFTKADPPIGGMRTWPQIKTNKPVKSTQTIKIADIPSGLRKLLKTKPPNPRASTTMTYINILQHTGGLGAGHIIHAHSEAPYRTRRDALEVM